MHWPEGAVRRTHEASKLRNKSSSSHAGTVSSGLKRSDGGKGSADTTALSSIWRLIYPTSRFGDPHGQLHIVYYIKFFAAVGYFMVSLTVTLYLSEELGFGDAKAGEMYGALGMLISLSTLPAGWAIDRFGVRWSLIIGSFLCTGSRLALAVTHSPTLAVVTLCTTLPLGEALVVPSLSAAVGFLTDISNARLADGDDSVDGGCSDGSLREAPAQAGPAADGGTRVRSAYGTFYTVMNVGLLCCGPLIDLLRWAFPRHPYRLSAFVAAGCGAAALLLAKCLQHLTATPNGDPLREVLLSPRVCAESSSAGDVAGSGGAAQAPAATASATVVAPAAANAHACRLRRGFLMLTALLVGVRVLFRHLDATFPKYFLRTYGDGAHFGVVYALEPLLIIVLVPLFSSAGNVSSDGDPFTGGAGWASGPGRATRRLLAAVRSLRSLPAIALGCYVGSAAPFAIALLGPGGPASGGSGRGSVLASPLFVAMVAVGEAIWAPRFYAYTHECAPPDQAGLYFGLSQVPLFLPKLLAGVVSGRLLAAFCPGAQAPIGDAATAAITVAALKGTVGEERITGCEEGWRLWGWVGLFGLPFPFAIHLCVNRGWILDPRRPEPGRPCDRRLGPFAC